MGVTSLPTSTKLLLTKAISVSGFHVCGDLCDGYVFRNWFY